MSNVSRRRITGKKPITDGNGRFVGDSVGIRSKRLKAKTATLVLAYGDGALIIEGSYLLLKSEGISSNYVVAEVKVSGGLLENN